MLDIAITIIIFVLVSITHIGLYRTIGEKTFWGVKLFLVYLAGFFLDLLLVFYISWSSPSLAFTSLLLYLLLTGVYFIFYISAFLGDESPATKIFKEVGKNGRATYDDLVKSFSDKKLVIKRIEEMKSASWITEKKGLYRLTPRGLYIMKMVNFYKGILKWERSG